MIEIKKSDLNQKHASFLFASQIKIDEEKKNLILFDYDTEKETNYIKSLFGKTLSGVNRNKNCFYNDELAFDNKTYFENRLYIDTSIRYFNTLSEQKISEEIIGYYGKAFDEKNFKNLVHDLMIRSHYKKNRLDSIGASLTSISLALSTYTNCIINLKNNELDFVEKALEKTNSFNYGITLLTSYTSISSAKSIIDKFDNVYIIKGFPLFINKVEKELVMVTKNEE